MNMIETMESTNTASAQENDDLGAAIQQVLRESPEPLTLSKVRAQLPARHRTGNVEEYLRRQVAANVLYQYPRYRSQQDRFWDRPMPVHVSALVRETLKNGPLGWSELRRKLPAYAQGQAEAAVQELVAQCQVHVHPRSAGRGGERFGLQPPDAKDYLRPELQALFQRLAPLGFNLDQMRSAALELLHEEEWAPLNPPPARETSTAEPKQDRSENTARGEASATADSGAPGTSQAPEGRSVSPSEGTPGRQSSSAEGQTEANVIQPS
jgi:hypothetical protein